MPKSLRLLLAMNACSSVISIYVGIFLNLFIWEKGQSIAEVSIYNVSMFISWGVAFTATAKLLTMYTIRAPFALSALSGGAAFAYLGWVNLDSRMLWIVLLGIPVGFMFGFSMAAQNLAVALRGKGSDYASYFGTVAIILQLLSIAVPIASAQMIEWFDYRGSFVWMLVFAGLMLVFSVKMPAITLPPPEGPEETREFGKFAYRMAFGRPGSKWILLSLLVSGMFLQFQNLFTLLFTFSVTQDKLLIALLNVLYTCSALAGLAAYRRLRLNADRWLWIGTFLLASGFLIVLLRSPAAMILSNVMTTAGMFFFTTVWNAQQFRFVEDWGTVRKTSFLVWRECILIVTRCLLLGLTLPLKELSGWMFTALIGVILLCLFSIPVFQNRAERARSLGEQNSLTA
jgi:MFS transporter, YQGE family, putative transporter